MDQNLESNEQVVNQATEQITEHENAQQNVMVKPNNNMLMATPTTLFCCLPFAIVATINASPANNLFAMPQKAAGQIKPEAAMRWSYIGVALGFIFWIIYIFAFSPLMRFIKTSL